MINVSLVREDARRLKSAHCSGQRQVIIKIYISWSLMSHDSLPNMTFNKRPPLLNGSPYLDLALE